MGLYTYVCVPIIYYMRVRVPFEQPAFVRKQLYENTRLLYEERKKQIHRNIPAQLTASPIFLYQADTGTGIHGTRPETTTLCAGRYFTTTNVM